jgi:hypothetical protein
MTSHIIAFTAAQPGWRLWLTYGYGEVEEESLAGWVLVAEVKTPPRMGKGVPAQGASTRGTARGDRAPCHPARLVRPGEQHTAV